MSSAAPSRLTVQGGSAGLTAEDRLILDRVDEFLARGLALKRWWDGAFAANSFAEKFELIQQFNRPSTSFGFLDQVQYDGGLRPVMGNFQEMFYDRPKGPAKLGTEMGQWMRAQVREFALHYFMRVSSFRQPEAFIPFGRPAPAEYLRALSWCPAENIQRVGFGFSQHYYKLRSTGEIGKFPSPEQFKIVDVREIGEQYEWIVVKVNIFDFKFTVSPLGPGGPQVVVPLTEESYLVLSREFISNEDNPAPGVLGQYGLGYAFIKDPKQGLIAYGPGQFDAAVELINFRVLQSGDIYVAMAFVVNQPEKIASVALDPLGWSLKLADLMSFGMSSRLMEPVKIVLDRLPTKIGEFDPVISYISLANALSGGGAARQLCISKQQLDTQFLVQHFMQHYQTIAGSLMTWRQIPDWLDSANLPEWVVEGRSS